MIGVTKFDENYCDSEENEPFTPETVAELICKKVYVATNIKIDPNIIIPISARWFVYSSNLQKCLGEMSSSHNLELQKKRKIVEYSLRNYPELDIECGQGLDIDRALIELPATLLVEKLSGASRFPLMKQR